MKILVIDDNSLIRESAQLVLGSEHKVTTAEDGKEGLLLIENEDFDVVLCDFEMPGMTGLQVRERLSPPLQERFVLWTATPPSQAPSAVRVLQKPSPRAELLTTVQYGGNRVK